MSEGRPAVLCIGGSDPGAGAGLHMDQRVVEALDCRFVGICAIETEQDANGLHAVSLRSAEEVVAEVSAALSSQRIAAIKTGALGSEAIVRGLYQPMRNHEEIPLVVDPVATASQVVVEGVRLLEESGVEALHQGLMQLATVVTPNQLEFEASVYSEFRAVFLKGGHAEGDEVVDQLLIPGDPPLEFRRSRLPGLTHAHGTGCALASAMAAFLACGLDLQKASEAAQAAIPVLAPELFGLDLGSDQ